MAKGHDDNNKCRDSDVAQQLTAANSIRQSSFPRKPNAVSEK